MFSLERPRRACGRRDAQVPAGRGDRGPSRGSRSNSPACSLDPPGWQGPARFPSPPPVFSTGGFRLRNPRARITNPNCSALPKGLEPGGVGSGVGTGEWGRGRRATLFFCGPQEPQFCCQTFPRNKPRLAKTLHTPVFFKLCQVNILTC